MNGLLASPLALGLSTVLRFSREPLGIARGLAIFHRITGRTVA